MSGYYNPELAMAIWKYQDASGNWQEARGRDIIALAADGKITPETLIESPDGKQTVAAKLQLKNKESLFKTSAGQSITQAQGTVTPNAPTSKNWCDLDPELVVKINRSPTMPKGVSIPVQTSTDDNSLDDVASSVLFTDSSALIKSKHTVPNNYGDIESTSSRMTPSNHLPPIPKIKPVPLPPSASSLTNPFLPSDTFQHKNTVFGTTLTILCVLVLMFFGMWFIAVMTGSANTLSPELEITYRDIVVVILCCIGFAVLCFTCNYFVSCLHKRGKLYSSVVLQFGTAIVCVAFCLLISIGGAGVFIAFTETSTSGRSIEDELAAALRDFDRESQRLEGWYEFEYEQRCADARLLPNSEDRNYEERMAKIDFDYKKRLLQIERDSLIRKFEAEKQSK